MFQLQEGNIKPPSKNFVPPLARGRGISYRIRTPAEHKRYVRQYFILKLDFCFSFSKSEIVCVPFMLHLLIKLL